MAINQLIAQGIAPIGRDVPDIINMQQRNALAQQGMDIQQQNALQYQRSLDMQSKSREQDIAAQRVAEARQWVGANYERLKADPAKMPQLVQLAKRSGVLPADIPDNAPLEDVAGILGVQAPAAEKPYGVTTQPGPYGSSIVSDGKRFDVVARPEPKSPAAADKGPNQQLVTRPAPGGMKQDYAFNPQTARLEPVGTPYADDGKKDGPPDTEGARRVRVLYGSVIGAEKQLATLKGVDTSSIANAAAGSNAATRLLQSPDFRRYESAALRWAANLLYIKSGATAPAEEVQSTYKQFFPQPGDPPDLQQQKAEARYQEMQSISDTYGLEAPPAPKVAAAGAPAPAKPGQTTTHRSGAKVTILPD